MRPPWPRPWPRPRPRPIPDQFQFQSQQQQVTTSAMRRRGCAVAVGFAIVVANTVAVAVAVADAASRAAAAECLRNGKRYLCTSVQGELSSCSVWFLLVPLVDLVLTSLGLDRFCRVVSPHTPPKTDQETFSFKNLRDSFVLVLVRYVKCIWWRRKQSKSLRKKHNIINVKQKRSWSPSTANQPINKTTHTHTHSLKMEYRCLSRSSVKVSDPNKPEMRRKKNKSALVQIAQLADTLYIKLSIKLTTKCVNNFLWDKSLEFRKEW